MDDRKKERLKEFILTRNETNPIPAEDLSFMFNLPVRSIRKYFNEELVLTEPVGSCCVNDKNRGKTTGYFVATTYDGLQNCCQEDRARAKAQWNKAVKRENSFKAKYPELYIESFEQLEMNFLKEKIS